MYVGSYLELYTTLFGWVFYNLIYNVLVVTGLIFVPIAILIFKSWKAASVNSKGTPAAELSVKNVAWDIAIMFVVIFLFVVPTITVFPTQIQFTPTSVEDGSFQNTVNAANSNTTFDSSLGEVSTASPSIPLWWLFLHRIMSGINYMVIDSLPSHMDLDVAKQQVAAANISDPNLAHQIPAFVSSCFVPAQGKLANWLRAKKEPANVRSAMDDPNFKPEDMNWIGSSILVETPGLYAPCVDRDACQEDLVANYPIEGLPQGKDTPCSTWWASLRQDLLAHQPPGIYESLKRNFSGMAGLSGDQVDDLRLRNMLNNYLRSSNQLADSSVGYYGDVGFAAQLGWVLKSAVGIAGATYESAKTSSKMHIIKLALPMVQALLLMMIYAFLPFYMMIAAYELDSMFTLTVVIAAIQFMTAIWGMAGWFEYNLFEALYPPKSIINSGTMGFLSSTLDAAVDPDHYIKGRVLSITTASLWLLMPAVFLYGLVWAGMKAGASVKNATDNTSQPSHDAGSQGGNLTGGALTGGSKAAGGATGKK